MVKTDFVLSFLTGQVDDEILDGLVNDKEVEFTIADSSDYWGKQQIKDGYKTPTGEYNKEKFLKDYEDLEYKFKSFNFTRFGNNLYSETEPETLEEGGTIPMYQNGDEIVRPFRASQNKPQKGQVALSEQEYYETSAPYVNPNRFAAPIANFRIENNFKYYTNKMGQSIVTPNAYKSYSEAGDVDFAKGKTDSQLAEQNKGIIDENGQLIEPSFFEKFNPKFARQVIVVDPVTGLLQEQILPKGSNVELLASGYKGFTTSEGGGKAGNFILDNVTAGENFFGARVRDKYKWNTHDWIGLKPFLGVGYVAEATAKGIWNTAAGFGGALTEVGKVAYKGVTNEENAPDWLEGADAFMYANRLKSDQINEDRPWYTPANLSYAVPEALGQVAALAGMTILATKYGKGKGFSDKAVEQAVKWGTGGLFALWGGEGIPDYLTKVGITDKRAQASIYLTGVTALSFTNVATNFVLKKLPANVQKQLIQDANRESLEATTILTTKSITDAGLKRFGDSLIKTVARKASEMKNKVPNLFSTGLSATGDEFTQEGMEAIIPDVVTLALPKMWNAIADASGMDADYKFNFSEYGEKEFAEFTSGEKLGGYFSEAVIGGLSGGIVGQALHKDDRVKTDPKAPLIHALTNGGTDFSEKTVERNFEEFNKQYNDLYDKGKMGPTNIGINQVTFKTEVITDKNKNQVKSFGDLTRTQALKDVEAAKNTLLVNIRKGGALYELKNKWIETNTYLGDEAFNKFALTFFQKRLVNGILMDNFRSFLSSQGDYKGNVSKMELLEKRNEAIRVGNTEEANRLQKKLLEMDSEVPDTALETEENKKKWEDKELLINTNYKSNAKYLSDLTDGTAFLRAMQQALLSTQINIQESDNGGHYAKNVLDIFKLKDDNKELKDGEAVTRFNNLNMTSSTSVDAANEIIKKANEKLQATHEKEIESLRVETEQEIAKANGKIVSDLKRVAAGGDMESIYRDIQDILDEEKADNGGIEATDKKKLGLIISFGKAESLTEEQLNVLADIFTNSDKKRIQELSDIFRDFQGKVIDLKTILAVDNIYTKRVDTNNFVSKGDSIEDYVSNAEKQSQEMGDTFMDGNLKQILKEIAIRKAQVQLNFGANRQMSDIHTNVFDSIADLLQGNADDLKASYRKKLSEFESIKLSKEKGKEKELAVEGSKLFTSIQDEATYLATLAQLDELAKKVKVLKDKSDKNTPDLDRVRIADDMEYAKKQLDLLSNLLKHVTLEAAPYPLGTINTYIEEISNNFDPENKVKEGITLKQEDLNKYIAEINAVEHYLHINNKKFHSDDYITAFKEGEFGYTKGELEDYVSNIKSFDVYDFYLELNSLKKAFTNDEGPIIPSFTQLESIKHSYWNLKRHDTVDSTQAKGGSKNHLQNMVLVKANQGAGKTDIVAKMVAKLYLNYGYFIDLEVSSVLSGHKGLEPTADVYTIGKQSYPIFQRTEDKDGTPVIKRYYYLPGKYQKGKNTKTKGGLKEVPAGVAPTTVKNVLIATKFKNRIKELGHSLGRKGGIEFQSVAEGANDDPTTDYFNTLIEHLSVNDKMSSINLIIIDEATMMTGEQLVKLNEEVQKINESRANSNSTTADSYNTPLKVLMLADMKQAGEISGLQGEFLQGEMTADKRGITFQNEKRNSNFTIRQAKELKAKFRSGNQNINAQIDYFRDGMYHNNDATFPIDYYQGELGLKGNKISDSREYELRDLEDKIAKGIVNANDYIVLVTTVEERVALSVKHPSLVVKTIKEAQGDTFKGVIPILGEKEALIVYAIFDKTPTNGKNLKLPDGTKEDLDKNIVIGNSIYNLDQNLKPSSIAIDSLDLQLAYDIISALGRAKEYTCLVLPKNSDTTSFLARSAETGNKGSKSSLTDVFAFNSKLNNSTKKVNEVAFDNLLKGEMGKKVGKHGANPTTEEEPIPEANTETVPEEDIEMKDATNTPLWSYKKSSAGYTISIDGSPYPIEDKAEHFEGEFKGYLASKLPQFEFFLTKEMISEYNTSESWLKELREGKYVALGQTIDNTESPSFYLHLKEVGTSPESVIIVKSDKSFDDVFINENVILTNEGTSGTFSKDGGKIC